MATRPLIVGHPIANDAALVSCDGLRSGSALCAILWLYSVCMCYASWCRCQTLALPLPTLPTNASICQMWAQPKICTTFWPSWLSAWLMSSSFMQKAVHKLWDHTLSDVSPAFPSDQNWFEYNFKWKLSLGLTLLSVEPSQPSEFIILIKNCLNNFGSLNDALLYFAIHCLALVTLGYTLLIDLHLNNCLLHT